MTPECINCHVEMELVKSFKNRKPGYSNSYGYRTRRFECSICGYQATIFADGYKDLVVEPAMAVKEAQKLYPVDENNSE